MAKPACTFCEQFEGVLMSTNLDDGETAIVCGTCIVPYALGLATTVTTGMDAAEAEVYADAFAAIAANGPKAASKPARARRTRPATVTPPQPPLDGLESDAEGRVELPAPCEVCGSTEALGDADKLSCAGCGKVLAYADGRDPQSEQPRAMSLGADPEQPILFDAPESEGA